MQKAFSGFEERFFVFWGSVAGRRKKHLPEGKMNWSA
jgi:hypothetical protein